MSAIFQPAVSDIVAVVPNDCDPSLIRFVKHGRSSKLLDQVARWTGSGWDPSRYVPNAKVPREIMRLVVGALRRQEVSP